jgi:hypothetical protein
MSASYKKDRVAGIGIYKAPPNLSKEAFETKITSLVDALLAVPIAQKNFLKFEIVCPNCLHRYIVFIYMTQIYQNDFSSPYLKALGFAEAPASVWLRLECEVSRRQVQIASLFMIRTERRPWRRGSPGNCYCSGSLMKFYRF